MYQDTGDGRRQRTLTSVMVACMLGSRKQLPGPDFIIPWLPFPLHSFAGQFYTVLDVEGIENVLKAIQKVWKAVDSQSLQAYLQRSQTKRDQLYMAVIIQEMVPPVISGVSFSINPITSLDEIVVEAVRGSGEQLVQEGAIPMHWLNKWGNWIELPEKSPLPMVIVNQILEETRSIVKTFRTQVDPEWVYDGKRLYWVQMRDITSIPGVAFYSNRMALRPAWPVSPRLVPGPRA